jgi:hypothetical protein
MSAVSTKRCMSRRNGTTYGVSHFAIDLTLLFWFSPGGAVAQAIT